MSDIKTVKLSEYDNSFYKPGSKIKIILWNLIQRFFFDTSLPWPSLLKVIILRLFGAQIGERVLVKPKIKIKYPWHLNVKSDVWIGEGVWIDNIDYILIGENVCISQGVYFVSGSHDYSRVTFDLVLNQIHVKDGVWIGAKAILGPGVTLERNVVVLPGAVILKDVKENMIVGGNPAIPIADRIITN